MARNISSGIDKIVKKPTKDTAERQLAKAWQDIKNRLDVLLLSNNVYKGAELRQSCLALNAMSHEDRQQYILQYWGQVCLDKALPLLQQLNTLERSFTGQ